MSETNTGTRQRLAAILAADAAGYSRLMVTDEAGTMAALDAARAVFRSEIEAQHGRVIDMAGDSILAVFETATGAVTAALAIQQVLEAQVSAVPADRLMRFRIGVHLGDVNEKPDGTVYGDGVNIAARLEGLALPGGVTVSHAVHSAVRHRISANFEDLGEQRVKNIVDPVRVYRVRSTVAGDTHASTAKPAAARSGSLVARWRWWAVAGLAVLTIGGLALGLHGRAQVLLGAFGISRDAIVPTDHAGPLTMSLAVGAFVVAADAALPPGAAHALREDLLSGIGSVERSARLVAVAPAQASSGEFRERARQAGARYFIEGDLRPVNGGRSVNLRLIETLGGAQVWSSRFELPESAATPDGSIARRRMIRQLVRAIENTEIARVLAKSADQLDPVELVLRAWSVLETGQSAANASEMRKLLDRALALDPTSVWAMHAVIAQIDFLHIFDPHLDRERYVRDFDRFSLRAVTLDPGYSVAWADRAMALLLLGRWNAALEASKRAIELDPYGGAGYVIRAWLMNMTGRPADAIPLAAKAMAMDPLETADSLRMACEAHLLLGEPAKAIATCERASGLRADFMHHSFLAAAYANAGDLAHAHIARTAMLGTVPGYTLEQLRAKRYSDHPEYKKLAERYWYEGLRKAGLAER